MPSEDQPQREEELETKKFLRLNKRKIVTQSLEVSSLKSDNERKMPKNTSGRKAAAARISNGNTLTQLGYFYTVTPYGKTPSSEEEGSHLENSDDDKDVVTANLFKGEEDNEAELSQSDAQETINWPEEIQKETAVSQAEIESWDDLSQSFLQKLAEVEGDIFMENPEDEKEIIEEFSQSLQPPPVDWPKVHQDEIALTQAEPDSDVDDFDEDHTDDVIGTPQTCDDLDDESFNKALLNHMESIEKEGDSKNDNIRSLQAQPTLTQIMHMQPNKRPRVEKRDRDTAEIFYLNVNGKRKSFKKGEVYENLTDKAFIGWYFRIESFYYDALRKYGVCEVYRRLEDSFIDKDEALRLIHDPSWKEANHGHFVRVLNPPVLDKGKIPLRKLENHVPDFPEPSLEYDCGPTIKLQSDHVEITYRYLSEHVERLRLDDTLEMNPFALELFGGCGGATSGLKQAGIATRYIVEKDPFAAASLKLNHPDAIVYRECVNEFLAKVKANTPGYPAKGSVFLIHTSSPCGGFSRANRNGGKQDLANNELSLVIIDAAETFGRPTFLTIENVVGMLSPEHKMYPQRIVTDLLRLGYQSRLSILKADDFGVPQERKRVFIIATKFECFLPSPPRKITGHGPKYTFEDALRDLEDVEPTSGSGLVQLPNGKIVANHCIEGTKLCKDSDHLSQRSDGMAYTIRCHRPVKHYKLARNLTNFELSKLQGFDDDYEFAGSNFSIRRQIGNAVPVGLAKCVFEAVMEVYSKDEG